MQYSIGANNEVVAFIKEYVPDDLEYSMQFTNETMTSIDEELKRFRLLGYDINTKEAKEFTVVSITNEVNAIIKVLITGELEIVNFTYQLFPLGFLFTASNLAQLDFSDVKLVLRHNSADYLFCRCNAKEIIFGDMDTSECTSMNGTFSDCINLEQLNLSNFDTSNVNSMASMFDSCVKLKELDLSNFNTTRLTNMQGMFRRCSELENINLSSFNTSNVQDLNGTFEDCKSLEKLDIGNLHTGSVHFASNLFYGCDKLKTLDLSGWKLRNVKTATSMFASCSRLETINLSSAVLKGDADIDCMFYDCTELKEVNLNSLNCSIEKVSGMFYNCRNDLKVYTKNNNVLKALKNEITIRSRRNALPLPRMTLKQ